MTDGEGDLLVLLRRTIEEQSRLIADQTRKIESLERRVGVVEEGQGRIWGQVEENGTMTSTIYRDLYEKRQSGPSDEIPFLEAAQNVIQAFNRGKLGVRVVAWLFTAAAAIGTIVTQYGNIAKWFGR